MDVSMQMRDLANAVGQDFAMNAPDDTARLANKPRGVVGGIHCEVLAHRVCEVPHLHRHVHQILLSVRVTGTVGRSEMFTASSPSCSRSFTAALARYRFTVPSLSLRTAAIEAIVRS